MRGGHFPRPEQPGQRVANRFVVIHDVGGAVDHKPPFLGKGAGESGEQGVFHCFAESVFIAQRLLGLETALHVPAQRPQAGQYRGGKADDGHRQKVAHEAGFRLVGGCQEE